jgi:hypothetical protein
MLQLKYKVVLACPQKGQKFNETVRFTKCKQLFECQHLLLLRDIWCSKFESIFKRSSIFQHQC